MSTFYYSAPPHSPFFENRACFYSWSCLLAQRKGVCVVLYCKEILTKGCPFGRHTIFVAAMGYFLRVSYILLFRDQVGLTLVA